MELNPLQAPLQLERICRACLSERSDMRPLFGACLDEMLVSFAGIQVSTHKIISLKIMYLFLMHSFAIC